MKYFVILILFVLSSNNEIKGQFKKFSGIHDKANDSVVEFLEKSGYGKVTYYFDNQEQIDGRWELYPSLRITNDLMAVHISTIPSGSDGYNFLLIINPDTKEILCTLGPFYDTFLDAISYKIRNNQIEQLTVRVYNPPELEEPKYTFIVYSKVNQAFLETKSYTKN